METADKGGTDREGVGMDEHTIADHIAEDLARRDDIASTVSLKAGTRPGTVQIEVRTQGGTHYVVEVRKVQR